MRKNGKRKYFRFALWSLIILLIVFYFGFEYPFRGWPFRAKHLNPPLTPSWALECWLWEDDANTAGRVDTLLQGYAEHDIPVRTILIDSPWSLRYNDFEPDTLLYPNPEKWFNVLQDKGYRVVLWMTSMVNSMSKDTRIRNSDDWYREAAGNGFLAGKSDPVSWWKGKGGFIDYTNPKAIQWWQGMQEKVLGWGIDGWKLDGTATLFRTMAGPVPLFYGSTYKGLLTTRTYMDHYYRDEYHHGLTHNPGFITLARAIDQWPHPEGFAPIDAAPVTWVGDQKHTWESGPGADNGDNQNTDLVMDGIGGIELALQNIIASAKLGYNIIGSDVAGFSGKTIPPRLYIRWAQFSAFCGLFLNGGHGERALWKRSAIELEIIRKFSWLHTEMIPYMYHYVVTAHNGGIRLQRPVKGKYHYLFGEDFLVAPIYKDDLTSQVSLPPGKWRYFFNDREVFEGPVTFSKQFPLDEYPVFISEGAIVPLSVERSYTGLGDESSKGSLTWMIYPGADGRFTVFYPEETGSSTVEVSSNSNEVRVVLKNMKKPAILRIHLEEEPVLVTFSDMQSDSLTEYWFNPATQKLIFRLKEARDGVLTIKK